MPRVGDFMFKIAAVSTFYAIVENFLQNPTDIRPKNECPFPFGVHMFSNEENMIMWIDMLSPEIARIYWTAQGFFWMSFRSINLLSRFIYPIYPCCNTLCMTNTDSFPSFALSSANSVNCARKWNVLHKFAKCDNKCIGRECERARDTD